MPRWRKALAYLRGWLTSLRHFSRPAWVCQVGRVTVVRDRGTITVGERVWLWPEVKLDASAVARTGEAALVIGDRVSIGDRTQIHCGERVTIGAGTLISWDCVIMDRDYHNPDGGAVVGAGSVVTRDVPPCTLVAGNSARVVRQLGER